MTRERISITSKDYEELYREWEEREKKRKLAQDRDEFIAKYRD